MGENMNATEENRKNENVGVSRESAEAQVLNLYEAFDVPTTDDDDDEKRSVEALFKAVEAGRLSIEGAGDDVAITQHLRDAPKGKERRDFVWNWRKLGVTKARLNMKSKDVQPYQALYKVAAGLMGLELDQVYTFHPIDLSTAEVLAGFFQSI